MDIKGRTVIVTGAGTGIGRVLAIEFARNGANVVCCGRREEPLKETAALVEKEGTKALAMSTDITVLKQVQQLVKATIDKFGQIDILFNNAGSFRSIAGIWELDPDVWWKDVTINLLGTMLITREVLPHMMARDEGIVISMGGGRPTGGSGYACGKAGLIQLSELLTKELKKEGSNVLAFTAPGTGLVRTEMTEYQANSEAGRKWIPSTAESFRTGDLRQPEEAAIAVMKMIRIARPDLNGMV